MTELGLDDSGQLHKINRVPGENDVRFYACVHQSRYYCEFHLVLLLIEWDGGVENDFKHSSIS